MEITVGYRPVDGIQEIRVHYYELIDGKGWSADLSVWVPWDDSWSRTEKIAAAAARDFLSRALSAHDTRFPG